MPLLPNLGSSAVVLLAGALLAGCVASDRAPRDGGQAAGLGIHTRKEWMAGDDFAVPPAGAARFTDFGLSVRTNQGVRAGGRIEWIVVTDIAPDSAAALQQLQLGDEIVALESVMLADLKGDVMQKVLFQRAPGDRIRLMIYRQTRTMPFFVDLVAGRQTPAR